MQPGARDLIRILNSELLYKVLISWNLFRVKLIQVSQCMCACIKLIRLKIVTKQLVMSGS